MGYAYDGGRSRFAYGAGLRMRPVYVWAGLRMGEVPIWGRVRYGGGWGIGGGSGIGLVKGLNIL